MDIDKLIADINKTFGLGVDPNVLIIKQAVDTTSEVMSFILGCIVWAILIGVPLVTALDVAYLAIPWFRNKFTELNFNQEGKVRIISRDACKAIEAHYEDESVSALGVYLKRRIKAYFLLALTITLVISGLWDMLVDWVVKMASVIVAIIYSW